MMSDYHYFATKSHPALDPSISHLEITKILEKETGLPIHTKIDHVFKDLNGDVEKIWADSSSLGGLKWRTEVTKTDVFISEVKR